MSLGDQAHAEDTLPAELSVKEIMDTWTLQKGYPVIDVYHHKSEGHLDLKQKKFNLEVIEFNIEKNLS